MALSQSQRLDRFAAALSAATGLNYDAARLWASAEVGAYNNLGIMDAPGVPHQYATPEEGARGAAQLINSSSLYAGIRASVASHDTHTQLLAIAQSPWHLGQDGLAKAGGTDPYYARIFGLSTGTTPHKPVGKGYGVTGGNTGNTTPGPSQGDLNPIDALSGIPKAIADFFGGTIESIVLDGFAILIGFIFVIIGLIMFLKGTSSPTEAIRETANDAIKGATMAAAATVDPAIAAGVASAGGKGKTKGRPVMPDIDVKTAAGMRDSAPGYSPETPRLPGDGSTYYTRKRRQRTVEYRDFFGNPE